MAFLLKELVFLAIVATALTYPWKPMANDIIYNTPEEQEHFPGSHTLNDGTDATEVDEPPPDKEVYPQGTNTHKKRGKESPIDEPPPNPLETNTHKKRGEAENRQAFKKSLRHFINRPGHMSRDSGEKARPVESSSKRDLYGYDRDPQFVENKKSRKRRGAVNSNTYRWPISTDGDGNNIVNIPYEIDSSLNSDAETRLRTVFYQLGQDTCINFVERTDQSNYVIFNSGSGCLSLIGYQPNPTQTVTLGSGCEYRATIAHEVMHLLGFFHEHTREDRDDYITVYLDNVISGLESEFTKRSQRNFGYSYDKKSIMQYGKTAFGVDGAVTMQSNSDANEELGAVSHMDANDLGKINALYSCTNAPTFVDHTIVLTTGDSTGDGTDGDVFLKLVGSSGTTPWQLVTSGGEYDDENEAGDVQTHYIPFPNVGTISSVKVALEPEGDLPSRKRRSIESPGEKWKRWFINTNGWTLSNLELDGTNYGGGELYENDVVTLSSS